MEGDFIWFANRAEFIRARGRRTDQSYGFSCKIVTSQNELARNAGEVAGSTGVPLRSNGLKVHALRQKSAAWTAIRFQRLPKLAGSHSLLLAAGVSGNDHGEIGYITPVPNYYRKVVCSTTQTRSKGFEGRPSGIAVVIGRINIIG